MAQFPAYDPYYSNYIYGAIPAVNSNDRNGGINTLFVSGLPNDVKAREIHNLFRRRPGFESCQLKYTGRGNQGVKFDPQTGSNLHIELARSNSRKTNKPGSGPYVVIDNRTTSTTDAHGTSSDDGGNDDEPNDPDSGEKDDSVVDKSEVPPDANQDVAQESEQNEKVVDPQACSTLFIANLGPRCTENEVKEAFSQYPGFNFLKLRARGGMPVAFADFEEIEQASNAKDALQGCSLPSSDRGGMHIEYARSKMRKL